MTESEKVFRRIEQELINAMNESTKKFIAEAENERLPKQVKVSGVVYSVSIAEESIIVDDKACIASINYDGAKIRISSECRPKRLSLWHEIIHAIAHDRMIALTEEQVEALARGVYQVLGDNPDLR